MKTFFIFLCFVLSGCATFIAPTNECRVSHFKGQAATGYLITMEADAKGGLEMIRVIQSGSGCKGVSVRWNGDKMKADVKKSE